MKKIAVFGAALNPPTYAHTNIIKSLSDKFDIVLVVPSFNHAFGKNMIPFEHRLRMAQLMIDSTQKENISLSAMEASLNKNNEKVYTIDVLNKVKTQFPEDEIFFIMGQDNHENFHKFYKYEEIIKNYKIKTIENIPEVRSTILREALINKSEKAKDLTIPAVINYIEKHNLYTQI